jgi:regulator of sirC expression with transglutaminase-like and TPR domain
MTSEEPNELDALTFDGEVSTSEPRLIIAALLIAREIAYEDLRPSRYLARLEEWADAFTFHVRRDAPGIERGQALARFLFTDLGIRGNEEEYYDPRNSYLNDVMDRRLGIPISLSALFLHIAERTGIQAEGIGLPGHFVVAVRDQEAQRFFDPFEGDEPLSREDLRDLLERRTGYRGVFHEEWVRPVDNRSILARMLFNLRGAYLGQDDWPKAVLVVERLVSLQPEVAAHRRDLGFILVRAGRPLAAADQLERYLLQEPEAEDSAMVRESIKALGEQGARLN